MLALMRRKLKSRKGFTLVELMVVVVIIGILVGIAVPSYKKVTGNAEKNACLANQRTIEGAVQVYKLENDGSIPSMSDLLDGDDPYLQNEIKCPTNGEEYDIDATTGAVSCDTEGHSR